MTTAGRADGGSAPRGLRLGTAVTLLVLGSTLAAALPLQWVWWHTARQASLELVEILSDQIVSSVTRGWWERVAAVEAAHGVAAAQLGQAPDKEDVRRALAAGLTATPVPSTITHRGRDHLTIAVRSRMGEARFRIEEYTTPTPALPRGWQQALEDPADGSPAVVFRGATGADNALSVYIGLDRFARLLSDIPVGLTGGAFVVTAEGLVTVRPVQGMAKALDAVVSQAAAIVRQRPSEAVNIVEKRRLVVDRAAYQVSFSPLEFNGWQFVVIVPEAEFFGDIEDTMWRTAIGLVVLVLVLGIAAVQLGQRVLSQPVAALASDLARIERFELEAIAYRPGGLEEFDHLSAAIAGMAGGLADFGKFIPTDLVRTLLADGVRAAPGGETRDMTILFADVAGFTGISERIGTAVIDIISYYFEVASRSVENNGGVVDKFIGDAVMALWGAPRRDPDQAVNACRAALALLEDVAQAEIVDDTGHPLRIRIGIHSGPAVVGNIGSARRLNYTAIGDTVNFASRLEGANKQFGSSILISEATRAAAGHAIITRELAEVIVVGKCQSIRIHELIGMADTINRPEWAQRYDAALTAFRARDFDRALELIKAVLALRPDDGPARWLEAEAAAHKVNPPPRDWNGVVSLHSK